MVTARGGSRRLPGKNLRVLGGKPLIVWSIDVAKDVPEICDMLVSTDDIRIAQVARSAGALVPWMRPAELASDTASSVDVALHALEWYEREHGVVDGLLLLQPTSPFRTKDTVREGLRLFTIHEQRPVVAVSPTPAHPMWTFKIEDDCLQPFMAREHFQTRSQDLPPAFVVNGSLYLVRPQDLRADRSFVGPPTTPLIIPSPSEALDIDVEWDWFIAETILASRAS